MAFDEIPSFTQNPLVQAIGNHLGMGPLLAAANGTPPPSPTPPAPQVVMRPGRSQTEGANTPREFRQHAPEARQAPQRGLGPGGGSSPNMAMPGVMSPDVLMHPEVQKLLGSYGITPDQLQQTVSNASPNLFITNPAAYEKHPLLSGMLEHGLEGAAFTHGGQTIGDSISNVAQGLLGAQAARVAKYNNQLMMPFAEAGQVAGLKNQQQEEDFKMAQAKHYQDLEDHYQSMDQTRQQYEQGLVAIKQQQEQISNQGMNLKYLSPTYDPVLSYVDKNALSALDQKYGSWRSAPPAEVDPIFAAGMAARNADMQKNKEKLANISNVGKIAAARAGGSSRTPNYENTDARNVYNNANKKLDQFDQDLSTKHVASDDQGNMLVQGDPMAATYRARLAKAVDDAKDAMTQSEQQLTVPENPGTNQPKSRHIPTYDPVTRTFK